MRRGPEEGATEGSGGVPWRVVRGGVDVAERSWRSSPDRRPLRCARRVDPSDSYAAGCIGRGGRLVGSSARQPAVAVGAQPSASTHQRPRHGNQRPAAERRFGSRTGDLRHRRDHQPRLDGRRAARHGQTRRLLHRGRGRRQLLLGLRRGNSDDLLRPAPERRGSSAPRCPATRSTTSTSSRRRHSRSSSR